MNRNRQNGVAMVEFALVALMFFMLIFGAVEFARAWFVYNTMTEMTRMGARIAAVCPADILRGRVRVVNSMLFDPDLTDVTTTTGILGLHQSNIVIEYLDSDRTPVGYPTGDDDGAGYNNIAFVRVSIVGFQFNIFVPLLEGLINTPSFSTTLPRESLGRIDSTNPVVNRNC